VRVSTFVFNFELSSSTIFRRCCQFSAVISVFIVFSALKASKRPAFSTLSCVIMALRFLIVSSVRLMSCSYCITLDFSSISSMWKLPKSSKASNARSKSFLRQIIEASVILSGRKVNASKTLIRLTRFKDCPGNFMYALVIGDCDMVTGFRLVGIKGVVVSTVDEARRTLSKAVESVDVALIIISEDFSTKMRDSIDKLRLNRIAPLIVELPGRLGPSSAIDMSSIVRKAIGVKV